jgi:hypothetical protein
MSVMDYLRRMAQLPQALFLLTGSPPPIVAIAAVGAEPIRSEPRGVRVSAGEATGEAKVIEVAMTTAIKKA